jgi:hypothetical protein
MKVQMLAAVTLLVGVSGVVHTQDVDSLSGSAATPATVVSQTESSGEAVERAIRLRDDSPWLGVPIIAPQPGPREVPAGELVQGPLAVAGSLEVQGTIMGDAIVYGGDMVVGPRAVIQGRAIALGGVVHVASGATVTEGATSLYGSVSPVAAPLSGSERTRRALVLVLAWLAIVVPIGVGVLVFAGSQLETITETLAASVGRSFLVGLAGQLAIIPVLLLGIVALAVTIIGILLIPIAIVLYTVAAAGLLMLGFLAAARLIGGAAGAARGADDLARRRQLLRALLVGILILFVPWLLAASLMSLPVAASVVHGIALLMTWVAITAGFGAVIRSRAGRRSVAEVAGQPEPLDDTSWQTPTPVGGVVAARRPTPTTSTRSAP